VGLRNHVLDGGEDQTNPFAAAKGDRAAMRPFAKLLWTLIIIYTPAVLQLAVRYVTMSVVVDDSHAGQASPRRPRVLQPSTELSGVRRGYQTGDLGLVPRANEHLCTRVDTMRWLSASLNYQMVGRLISRSVATQTPQSWT